MPLPRPEPGLVIHYEYLWRHEHERQEERGSKRRPCAIVVAVAGTTETVVAPITHREPTPPSEGIEIPRRVKESLGLDSQRSWIIITDLNVFIWPGIDVYPVPNSPPGTFEYGYLPPRLFDMIRSKIEAAGSLPAATRRTE
jgi:hypothetical protein